MLIKTRPSRAEVTHFGEENSAPAEETRSITRSPEGEMETLNSLVAEKALPWLMLSAQKRGLVLSGGYPPDSEILLGASQAGIPLGPRPEPPCVLTAARPTRGRSLPCLSFHPSPSLPGAHTSPFLLRGAGVCARLRGGRASGERRNFYFSVLQGRAGSVPNPGEPEASDPPVHRQHQTGHLRGAALRELGPRLQLGAVVHVHQPPERLVGRRRPLSPHQVCGGQALRAVASPDPGDTGAPGGGRLGGTAWGRPAAYRSCFRTSGCLPIVVFLLRKDTAF